MRRRVRQIHKTLLVLFSSSAAAAAERGARAGPGRAGLVGLLAFDVAPGPYGFYLLDLVLSNLGLELIADDLILEMGRMEDLSYFPGYARVQSKTNTKTQ